MLAAGFAWVLSALFLMPPEEKKEPQISSVHVETELLLDEPCFVLAEPVLRYCRVPGATRLQGWSKALGLSLAEVDAPLRVHLNLKPSEGVLVTAVDEKGAAGKAQLRLHDVILGLPVQVEPARSLELTAIRAGQRHKVVVETALAPKQFWIGVQTGDLDDALRTQLSLPAGRGILISEVIDKGPAQKAGLLKHDVVIGLDDGAQIKNTEEFSKAVQTSAGKPLRLQIVRHAKSMTVAITPVERPQEQPQKAQADNLAQDLSWVLTHNRPAGSFLTLQPDMDSQIRWKTVQALQLNQAPHDAAAKITALQGQVEQLLKEVTALRQALEKKPAAEPKK